MPVYNDLVEWGPARYPNYLDRYRSDILPAPNLVYTPPQMGCICPPGANRDCESPACPRQNRSNPTE